MSEDNRKTTCSCISHNKKLIEISEIIGYDPRAISKEVKRNRKPVDYADQNESKSFISIYNILCIMYYISHFYIFSYLN